MRLVVGKSDAALPRHKSPLSYPHRFCLKISSSVVFLQQQNILSVSDAKALGFPPHSQRLVVRQDNAQNERISGRFGHCGKKI